MAIYLDTNIIYGWRTFTGLDRLAMSIVADQLAQPLVLPQTVADEAQAQYARELTAAVDRFDMAAADLQQLFPIDFVHAEPMPVVADQLAR